MNMVCSAPDSHCQPESIVLWDGRAHCVECINTIFPNLAERRNNLLMETAAPAFWTILGMQVLCGFIGYCGVFGIPLLIMLLPPFSFPVKGIVLLNAVFGSCFLSLWVALHALPTAIAIRRDWPSVGINSDGVVAYYENRMIVATCRLELIRWSTTRMCNAILLLKPILSLRSAIVMYIPDPKNKKWLQVTVGLDKAWIHYWSSILPSDRYEKPAGFLRVNNVIASLIVVPFALEACVWLSMATKSILLWWPGDANFAKVISVSVAGAFLITAIAYVWWVRPIIIAKPFLMRRLDSDGLCSITSTDGKEVHGRIIISIFYGCVSWWAFQEEAVLVQIVTVCLWMFTGWLLGRSLDRALRQFRIRTSIEETDWAVSNGFVCNDAQNSHHK
jgi:hypothetical protein